MPSYRVNGSKLTLAVFDIVGQDGDAPGFVRHSGLVAESGSYESGRVGVHEMGPPLKIPGKMHAHVIGAAELTDDEVRRIQVFIDRHASEHKATMSLRGHNLLRSIGRLYCIYPHRSPYREADGRTVRMRFSCAGFVFEAYKNGGVRLVDEDTMPPVDMRLIRQAYPDFTRLIDDGNVDPSALGLTGSGPWPVMLCGYLFHALNRDPAAVRSENYSPTKGDEIFPRRQ